MNKNEETEETEFKLSFGKFKGKTLDMVYSSGVDYLKWLVKQKDLHDETRKEINDFLESKKGKKKA